MLKRYILVVLEISACGELICLLGMVICWKIRRDDLMSPKQTQLCLSSGNLLIEEQDTESLSDLAHTFNQERNETLYKSSNNSSETCKEELPYMEVTYSKICKRYCTAKDAAHLSELASYAAPVPGKPTKLYWKQEILKSADLKHLGQEGTILVSQSGLYFVSSQIALWVENSTSNDNDDDTMRHFVNVIFKDGMEKVLLENAMSKCDITGEESQKTSMMEAVFWLDAHDRIFVASSHPHKLVSSSYKNHLMVYSL